MKSLKQMLLEGWMIIRHHPEVQFPPDFELHPQSPTLVDQNLYLVMFVDGTENIRANRAATPWVWSFSSGSGTIWAWRFLTLHERVIFNRWYNLLEDKPSFSQVRAEGCFREHIGLPPMAQLELDKVNPTPDLSGSQEVQTGVQEEVLQLSLL